MSRVVDNYFTRRIGKKRKRKEKKKKEEKEELLFEVVLSCYAVVGLLGSVPCTRTSMVPVQPT